MKCAPGLTRALGAVFLLAIQVSCGGGDSPGGPSVPTTMAPNSATTVSGSPGGAVEDRPSVIVRDQSGSPLAGVTVTFAVTSGGGSVTGGSQVTNTSGIATVESWTLGTTVGTNTLTASAANLPPMVFTASSSDSCAARTAHTIGTNNNGALTTTDCHVNGSVYMDFYSTTIATAGMYQFTQTAAFDTFLFIYGPDGFAIAVNDDESGTSRNSRIKVLLPSGNILLGPTSFDQNVTGSYTLSSAAVASNITGCEIVSVARGITTNQSLQTTDCLFNGLYSDDVLIFLKAGQEVAIEMTSSAVDAFLELWTLGGLRVAFNDDADATGDNARLVYTSTSENFFLLAPTTAVAGQTGDYTLTIGP